MVQRYSVSSLMNQARVDRVELNVAFTGPVMCLYTLWVKTSKTSKKPSEIIFLLFSHRKAPLKQLCIPETEYAIPDAQSKG